MLRVLDDFDTVGAYGEPCYTDVDVATGKGEGHRGNA